MFKELTDTEAAEFRRWARENYIPGTKINPLWHPVTRRECEQMNINTRGRFCSCCVQNVSLREDGMVQDHGYMALVPPFEVKLCVGSGQPRV